MPCVKLKFPGDRYATILNMAPPVRRIVSAGKEFFFEFHEYLGPSIVNKKTGNPTGTWPRKNSPFWDALHFWLKQGKQVDAEGNCIFKHEMQLVQITKQIGKRSFLILTGRPHPPKIAKLLLKLAEVENDKDQR